MFRDGRPGNGKLIGNMSGGEAASQQVEHGSARWIRQGPKGRLGQICNRTVPHNA